MRTVLTIPLTEAGPDELAKLIDLMAAGHVPEFIGPPFWMVEPDGVRMLALPVEIPTSLGEK